MEESSKGKHHDRQFIESIIKLVRTDRMSVAQVSQQTGLRRNLIYRWLAKYDLEQARQDPTSEASRELDNLQLRRENEELKRQVEFLKKAATYFASQNHDDLSSSRMPVRRSK